MGKAEQVHFSVATVLCDYGKVVNLNPFEFKRSCSSTLVTWVEYLKYFFSQKQLPFSTAGPSYAQ